MSSSFFVLLWKLERWIVSYSLNRLNQNDSGIKFKQKFLYVNYKLHFPTATKVVVFLQQLAFRKISETCVKQIIFLSFLSFIGRDHFFIVVGHLHLSVDKNITLRGRSFDGRSRPERLSCSSVATASWADSKFVVNTQITLCMHVLVQASQNHIYTSTSRAFLNHFYLEK